MDQAENAYLLLMVNVSMYLVNTVLQPAGENDESVAHPLMLSRHDTLFMIAALHVLPWLLLHAVDTLHKRMNIRGIAVLHMRKTMFRKYMNYNEVSQTQIGGVQLEWAIR